MFEIYARKEPKTSQRRSSLAVNVHPQLKNCNSPDGFTIIQSNDFLYMIHFPIILIDQYDFNLNETIIKWCRVKLIKFFYESNITWGGGVRVRHGRVLY